MRIQPLDDSSTLCEETHENRQRYKRIATVRRNALLEKIFFENKKIKIAAREMNMNYSSAKTILHLYRKKSKKIGTSITSQLPESMRCGYSPVPTALTTSNTLPKMEVVISLGGRTCSTVTIGSGQLEMIPAVLVPKTNELILSAPCSSSNSQDNQIVEVYEKQVISSSNQVDLCQLRSLFDIQSSDCSSSQQETNLFSNVI